MKKIEFFGEKKNFIFFLFTDNLIITIEYNLLYYPIVLSIISCQILL